MRIPFAALLIATALAAGCGGSSSSSTGSSGSSGRSAPSTSGGGGTTGGGASSGGQIPAKTSQKVKNAAIGTTVVITPTGFSPHVLIAPFGFKITWKNESGKVQSVHLDNVDRVVDSGPIQPGTAWSFNPHSAVSILYHSTYDPSFTAQAQVTAVGNS
jgi:hypothetical protein